MKNKTLLSNLKLAAFKSEAVNHLSVDNLPAAAFKSESRAHVFRPALLSYLNTYIDLAIGTAVSGQAEKPFIWLQMARGPNGANRGNPMNLIIIDLQTGLVDGVYTDRQTARETFEALQAEEPGAWLLCEVIAPHQFEIPDERFWGMHQEAS